ncbi:MAG: Unknown protein [uncultured Sulfurovum sp.]|uniref:Uncharacterized protein n=1 Tax=uncultured Sulfurovum sp. TaxID=269237 RepID=A0A6S6TQK3_9BACT|nr:MAG: Unknown protein [uncultured Sulfurovum sp.]
MNYRATCAIIALLTTSSHAKQGVYIVEPFSCEVALLNYHHLTETVKENNPPFVQTQLELSLRLTREELAEHSECNSTVSEVK